MEEKATFAGGCFWCIESAFMKENGVLSTRSGYTGGTVINPSYEEVCSGTTGHFEAVEILFDPEKITFNQLLDIFWRHIDPLDDGGQFFDRGSQYRTAVFYHDFHQKVWAEKSKNALQSLFAKPIATKILPADIFYPAEEYHQKYCYKQPQRYEAYRKGHESSLKRIWEDKKRDHGSEQLKETLTSLQYHVTQEEGTEPPFRNDYWDNKEEGIYVDIISGVPLFLSSDKFDSKSGWPSFTKPLDTSEIIENEDYKLGVPRTEVKSVSSGAHLGHVFSDGPKPTGLRYCINSASLRFIPKDKLREQGYEEFLRYF